MFNRAQFLIQVLGADAARALAKAASRSEYLSQMIVPRTILAMLEAVPAYQGTVPGFEDCSLTYAKSETGFTGNVTLGEDFYKFEDASIFHVAGAVSTAMGLDSLLFNSGRNTELQRLGKSIDMMAKAHLVVERIERIELRPDDKDDDDMEKDEKKAGKKGTCEVCGGKGGKHEPRLIAGLVLDCRNDPKKLKKEELEKAKWPPGSGSPHQETTREPIGHKYEPHKPAEHKHKQSETCPKCGGTMGKHNAGCQDAPDLKKKALGEGAGKSAGPVAPAAPTAPTASAAAPTTPQKLPKMGPSATPPKPAKPVTSSTVKLTRSEKTRACPVCSMKQFNADDKFVGCLCFRALAKSVDWTDHFDHVELRLGSEWDRETIVTFLEAVGRK